METVKCTNRPIRQVRTMELNLSRAVTLAAYQLALVVGIALFPIAVLANKVGVSLPIHRLLAWLDGVYERVDSR